MRFMNTISDTLPEMYDTDLEYLSDYRVIWKAPASPINYRIFKVSSELGKELDSSSILCDKN